MTKNTRGIPERKGTKSFMIRELCERGMDKRSTFNTLRPLVESQTAPMIFSSNPTKEQKEQGITTRQPKSIAEQLIELKNEIGRVYVVMGRSVSADFDSDDISPDDAATPDPVVIPEPEEEPVSDDKPEEEPEEDKRPVSAGKERIKGELRFFLSEVRRIRALCESRAATGSFLDWISIRPVQAAAKLIPAGIPAAALLHAMTLHWKPEIRREAGIPDFDYVAFSREIMEERGIDPDGKHELFGYVLLLVENRQPVMLIGPAGTGKSFILRQVADFLSLDYGETPMTSGATRGDLLGRMTASRDRPFILSRFAQIYANGGMFNFEELDASDENMVIVLNNALAGEALENSANGERYDRHENFAAAATANTFATGANSIYTGRTKLDAATIDRWRMGRLFMPLDETVEEDMLYGRI